jgi:excisionase family DNA binding protein
MNSERFTTNEAAERLGVSPARVRQMVASGEIESEKFGRDTVITAEALKVAATRKTKPGPTPKAKADLGTIVPKPKRTTTKATAKKGSK